MAVIVVAVMVWSVCLLIRWPAGQGVCVWAKKPCCDVVGVSLKDLPNVPVDYSDHRRVVLSLFAFQPVKPCPTCGRGLSKYGLESKARYWVVKGDNLIITDGGDLLIGNRCLALPSTDLAILLLHELAHLTTENKGITEPHKQELHADLVAVCELQKHGLPGMFFYRVAYQMWHKEWNNVSKSHPSFQQRCDEVLGVRCQSNQWN